MNTEDIDRVGISSSNKSWGEWLGASDAIPPEEVQHRLFQQLSLAHEEITKLQKKLDSALTELEKITVPTVLKGRKRYLKEILSLLSGRKVGVLPALQAAWRILRNKPQVWPLPRRAGAEAVGMGTKSPWQNRYVSPLAGDNCVRRPIEEKDYETAYLWGRALFPKHGKNQNFVALLERAAVKRGNISQTVALANYKATMKWIKPEAVRIAQGRLKELYTSPVLPASPIPEVERHDDVVVHLVKESAPYLSNGFTSRTQANLKAEVAAGFTPVVLTEPGFPGVELYHDSTIEFVEGIEHRRLLPRADEEIKKLPLDEFGSLFAQLALKHVQEIKPAVIHVSSGRRGYETAKVALAIGEATGVPVVYEIRSFFEGTWTSETAREEMGEQYHARKDAEFECAMRASHVITICETMRDELVSWGIPAKKITVIPNGVDTDRFSPSPKNLELKKSLGLDDSTVIGYVSNLDHIRESQETLVRATATLVGQGLDVKCLLVGGGPRLEGVRQLADNLGIGDRLITPGGVPHDEVPDYYRLIDVFVVPRRDERAARLVTPLKPFEAMACKIPVVCSDLPALREIVDPPHRGLTFPERDHEALANVLLELISSETSREALGSAGEAWVRDNRLWPMNGSRYKSAYKAAKEGDHAQ